MTELQLPTVHFKHIALLAVEGSAVGECAFWLRQDARSPLLLTDSARRAGSDLRWSTEAAVNDLYGDSLRVAEVSVRSACPRPSPIARGRTLTVLSHRCCACSLLPVV